MKHLTAIETRHRHDKLVTRIFGAAIAATLLALGLGATSLGAGSAPTHAHFVQVVDDHGVSIDMERTSNELAQK